MKRPLRIKLIAPASNLVAPGPRTVGLFPPLALQAVAALVPPEHEVVIADESIEPLDLSDEPDLVGITALTAAAPRAYAIADAYRRRGIRVVLGGMHPSALPEEALAHADAVVVGEAEGSWPQLLSDLSQGRLQRIYRRDRFAPLQGLPLPRRDLVQGRRYLVPATVQTSRGCPHHCAFCSVSRFFGRTYRTRPIPEVLKEIESLGTRTLVFVDDNLVGDPARARRLFEALVPYRLRWLGQSSLDISRDPGLLRLAAKSGCVGLFIGFESLSRASLAQAGKAGLNRPAEFAEAIRRIHDQGIGIEGAFVFGFDHDGPDVFERTVSFAQRLRLAAAQFGILTPFPGTALRRQLEKAGRIVVRDWARYTISHAVFEPLNMTRERLEEGFRWAYREFYSYRSILGRLLPRLFNNFGVFLTLNLGFRRALQVFKARTRAPYPAEAAGPTG
ncbi:MAG: B12-binding domain-containing radical SAM protein [Acetobacteraceae bacterium]|nr:B12-binding domain-containing radical SAM protein [Acetobacteraceae bacterium]